MVHKCRPLSVGRMLWHHHYLSYYTAPARTHTHIPAATIAAGKQVGGGGGSVEVLQFRMS